MFIGGWKLQAETNGLNMNISQMTCCDISDFWQYKNAKNTYARIYLIKSGEGTAEITYGEKTVYLKPGNIYFIPSNFEFSHSCKGNFYKMFCHFNLLRYDNYDFFSQVSDVIVLENRMKDIDRILNAFYKGDMESCFKLKIMLFELAFEALKKSNAKYNSVVKYSPYVSQALEFINKECKINIKSASIAEMLHISVATLQKHFKNEVGVSLGKYINTLVITKAEADLRTTNASVKDIAEKYGFCDQFYFTRIFTEAYHSTPTKYRSIHKIKEEHT